MSEPDVSPEITRAWSKVTLTIDNRVARITLASPPLNMLTLEMMGEITEAIHDAARAEAVCAIVFESSPECRAFSAGIAIEEHKTELAYQMLDAYHAIFRNLDFYSKPTVAIVTDNALGGGCEIAAFCDIVIASEKARFGLPEIKVGVFPPLAAVYFPRVVGLKRAKELILTGSLLTAAEAREYGLVTYVVPEAQVASKTSDVLNNLRKLSAPVLEVARRAITEVAGLPLDEGLGRAEDIYLNQLMNLKDPAEGMTAFLEKRSPQWKHK